MYACVVNYHGREMYSSFHRTEEEAVEYAKAMPGVMRVEKAHSKEPPIWVRES